MRLVVVSNRLPIVVERNGTGALVRPSSGGLVSALSPIMRRHGGLWIGWPGTVGTDLSFCESVLSDYGAQAGYGLVPIAMSKSDVEGFYQGFSNEIIWPLFHDLQGRCNFVPEYWTRYVAIRHAFADAVLRHVRPGDFVWVQDYHLMGMGLRLRERGLRNPIAFFLHIPFPPPDIFCKLPWRQDVLDSLLRHDLIGFQTPRDVENFLDCVRKLQPSTRILESGGITICSAGNQQSRVGAFPIGIDYERVAGIASSADVVERSRSLRERMPRQQIVLSVDRLDYTKGIPYRLRAFRLALQRYPDLLRNVTMLQVVVPSRENVPEYQELKSQIERLVTQINGEFTCPGWVPIHHVYRNLEDRMLMSYYRAADVGLVTPLKDGMNLIAKEFCASQVDECGALILSEFAGAAVQLGRDALLVNPYDLDGVAETIRRSVKMSPQQRKPAMKRLRSNVKSENVFWWVNRFLDAFGSKEKIVEHHVNV